MDGNGRWAKQRLLPRVAGHRKGVESVRAMVRTCIERGVDYLTLFAFSSENWRRPAEEVSILMQLFVRALEQEVAKLHGNGIRFRVIGDTSRFEPRIRELIVGGEALTATNSRLTLTVAANYGGRWDIAQAAGKLIAAHPDAARGFTPEALDPYLSMSYAPEPDLFIRTGGERYRQDGAPGNLVEGVPFISDQAEVAAPHDRGLSRRVVDPNFNDDLREILGLIRIAELSAALIHHSHLHALAGDGGPSVPRGGLERAGGRQRRYDPRDAGRQQRHPSGLLGPE